MGTYKKINGQAVPVTTEGHPQYYFQTKAQAEAALSTLEIGADVFVEEGGNEDVLPRVQELEEDVSEINSNLTVKNITFTPAVSNTISNLTAKKQGNVCKVSFVIASGSNIAGNTVLGTLSVRSDGVAFGNGILMKGTEIGVRSIQIIDNSNQIVLADFPQGADWTGVYNIMFFCK